MNTGQFYGRTKKTLPPNRIIVPSEESDDDMVGSSDSEIDISIDSDSARVGSVEESFISEEGKEKIGVYPNVNNNNMYLNSTLDYMTYYRVT